MRPCPLLQPSFENRDFTQERSLTAVDFGLFAACGAVGCTTTHLTVIPLDVVKTRLQTDPGRYEGLTEGVTTIAREVSRMWGVQHYVLALHPAERRRISARSSFDSQLPWYHTCISLLLSEARVSGRVFLLLGARAHEH